MINFDSKFEQVLKSVQIIMNNMKPFDRINTIATHGGFDPLSVPDVGCPVVAPISLATTFKQSSPGVAKYDYSRSGNFSRECLEKCVAQLEDGDHCSVFSTGVACLGAIVQVLSSEDHIVACDDMYGGSDRYLRIMVTKCGMASTFVDMSAPEQFRAALKPNTRLVLIETPSNPLMRLVNISEIAEIAHKFNRDILVAADNTFMSSYFQRPLDHGADISWHSLTKYMNGHSDVLMGALVTRNHPKLREKFKFIQMACGAVPSAFDCYLCLRGLRTLPLRMQAHMRNALIVAKMLEQHPNVSKVLHPALDTHPQHKLAMKQMCGFSGMVTVYLRCNAEQTTEFIKNIKLFYFAESLGGFDSLVKIPSVMTQASVGVEIRAQNDVSDNMLRLSVGLEDPKELVHALFEGLNALPGTE